MFRVKEKQFKNIIKNIKDIFKKAKINKFDLISPNIYSLNFQNLVKVNSYKLKNIINPQIKTISQKNFLINETLNVNSNLSFFNNMKLVFKPIDVSEINKKQFIGLVSSFHKKTLLSFNNVEIQAVYLDVPVTGKEKITFDSGNLIVLEREDKLQHGKCDVIIYKKTKGRKSNVVVLDDRN